MSERDLEIVLFGATGFTGELTAEYLARNAPSGTRWALAGRNRAKLEAVRGRLAAIDHALSELPLIEADSTDSRSLGALAASTKLVITTVGPYIQYGEPLVAACAENGTDYVDLTGEPEFVDRMWLGYHELAQRTGARLVHSCGFDSIPYDLGALYTVERLPDDTPIELSGFGQFSGSFSGDGPNAEQRARSRFRVRFLAITPSARLVTEVSGGDPGYGETSKMLAESALCLAHDVLPETSGQVTTAVAMGDVLIERLQRAGITFGVVDGA